MSEYLNIDPIKFNQIQNENKDCIVIDCRNIDEIRQQALNYNLNINLMNPTDISKINSLDKNQTYIIYCHSGNRSSVLCDFMLRHGFKNIYNLEGGICNWNYYKSKNLI